MAAASRENESTGRGGPARMALYASVIFAGALLLFLIQPMIARQLLPRFGGAAAVWAACMMFFQVMLLLGYLYADWTTRRLGQRAQGVAHAVLVAAGTAAAWIPLDVREYAAGGPPAVRVVALLAATIGLPYFVLSSTSPLMQSWCAAVERRAVPYRLYALSNLGSLLALLSYPFVIEPAIDLPTQMRIWRAGYVVFAVLSLVAAVRAARAPGRAADREVKSHTPALQKLVWMALAACPSIVLLAVTNELCENIAPVPLLWIAPLAVYLITFIICFNYGPVFPPAVYRVLVPLALAALTWAQGDAGHTMAAAAAVCLGGVFVVGMFCHGQLASQKPEGAEATSFYLWIAAGGAAGGVFVGMVAPSVFSTLFELPVGIVLALGFCLHTLFSYRPTKMVLICCAVALVMLRVLANVDQTGGMIVYRGRNFYGTVVVNENGSIRKLIHGKTVHGNQPIDDDAGTTPLEPTTYYGRESGVGLALSRGAPPRRVGAVGLGVGTVAAYGRTGDSYRFYEINPLVEQLARTRFRFLASSAARIEVVEGDARLSLAREAAQGFDTLILDAFSGDSIPVHLLTVEAFELYLRHMKPDAVLAVHVSNRFLDLAPLVAALADGRRSRALLVESPGDERNYGMDAYWVLVSANPDVLRQVQGQGRGRFLIPDTRRAWTDQYSNILSVLKP